jgi:transcriptional regulator with XRE-family HTH domain
MPRPASKRHVLRTAREILGLSQVALAKEVGFSAETIKRLENHSLAMSKDAVRRITEYTGLHRGQLARNIDPDAPLNCWGDPFTKEWFERGYRAELSHDKIDHYVKMITSDIRWALDACAGVQPKRVSALIGAFDSAIEEVTNQFRLT